MRVLDLFSGIGGFSLGLERAGMRTVAFCEIDPYARAVLNRHWPDVPCYEDVRAVTADRLRADGILGAATSVADAELSTADRPRGGDERSNAAGRRQRGFARSDIHSVDVICGGFPCQDISYAGKGAGLAGERSGLWREIARLVGEIRPRYVVLENVSALLSRGLGDVLGDLASLGYDAEWHCIPASYVGAPHRRDRIWIVAYPLCCGWEGRSERRSVREGESGGQAARQAGGAILDSGREPLERRKPRESDQSANPWLTEPDVGRVAHGVPARVDRLRCLGNAVVPQVVEMIGRAIMAAEAVDTNAGTRLAATQADAFASGLESSGAGGGTRTPDPRITNAERHGETLAAPPPPGQSRPV